MKDIAAIAMEISEVLQVHMQNYFVDTIYEGDPKVTKLYQSLTNRAHLSFLTLRWVAGRNEQAPATEIGLAHETNFEELRAKKGRLISTREKQGDVKTEAQVKDELIGLLSIYSAYLIDSNTILKEIIAGVYDTREEHEARAVYCNERVDLYYAQIETLRWVLDQRSTASPSSYIYELEAATLRTLGYTPPERN